MRLHFSPNPPAASGYIHIPAPQAADRANFVAELPWGERSVDEIVIAHLIDQFTPAEAIRLLHECRRILRPGGRLRVLTIDLAAHIDDYAADRISPCWEKDGKYWTGSRCERINLLFRDKHAQWLYDEDELVRVGTLVGLRPHARIPTAPADGDSILSLEFEKPDRRLAIDARPLVSISIPTFKPAYFEATLKSALAQTWQKIEVLICDDCPDDGIARIAERYVAQDSRVRYLRNPERLGRANLARCLEVAQGEFFKLLCDDDLLAPDAIERMLDCFRRDDDITLVTSRRQRIDEHDAPLPDIFETLPPVGQDFVAEGISLGAALLSSARNFVGEPSTALFRKSEVAHVRPDYCSIDGQIINGMNDVAVWINLAQQGNTAYLVDALSMFRSHPQQNQQLHREMLVADSLAGLQIMRSAFDRQGFSDGQYFGTIKWRPLGNQGKAWQLQTIRKDFSGWSPVNPPTDTRADNEERHYREAAAMLARGDTDNAIAALIAMAEKGCRHWAVYNDLGTYAWNTGDQSSALDLFRQAWQLSPALPLAGCNLAQALLAMGHRDDAGSTIAELQQRHPGNADIQALRQRLDQLRN